VLSTDYDKIELQKIFKKSIMTSF